MTHYCSKAGRTAFTFECFALIEIAHGEPRQGRQRPERTGESVPSKSPRRRFRFNNQLRHASTPDGNERVKFSRITNHVLFPAKNLGPQAEKPSASPRDPFGVHFFVEQGGPSIFQRR